MAYNNHAASVSSHYSPDPDPQLINGVSTNPEDGDVTQDATQRRPTSGRDDTIGLDDCPDINAASKYNSANIKDESQNTQTKAHNVEADDQGEDETEAAVGDGHGAKNEAHEEPPEEEQDQMSERAQILRELSWDDLQQAFQEQMDKKTEEEEMLKHEFQQYTELYLDWASMPAIKEEERAAKRLKTRIAYAQHKEGELHAKEHHLKRVREAFQQALGMLTGG